MLKIARAFEVTFLVIGSIAAAALSPTATAVSFLGLVISFVFARWKVHQAGGSFIPRG